MNSRTSYAVAMLAASMLAGTYCPESFPRRARGDRWDPHTPKSTREKQAKNKYRRKKGKR